MRSLLKYLMRRFFFAVLTLFIMSVVLYGIIFLSPLDMRVSLFMPPNMSPRVLLDFEEYDRFRNLLIEQNHLNDPFPTQYWLWGKNFISNKWGFSPSLNQQVLPAIMERSPVTIELMLGSMLLIIPLSLVSGMQAANKKDKMSDFIIRTVAMITSHIPLFVMAYFLLAIFYVSLRWTTLTGLDISWLETSEGFRSYTGMSFLDGLLNGRLDVALMAIRRLSLPVITIAATQWAFLSRITRNSSIEELQKDYVLAAKARGASQSQIFRHHILKNTLSVFLSNTALSAASIVTGVFIVERIFVMPGVSEILFRTGSFVPDAVAVIGFTFYCVLMVLFIMLILDVLNAAVNPLISQEMIGGADAT